MSPLVDVMETLRIYRSICCVEVIPLQETVRAKYNLFNYYIFFNFIRVAHYSLHWHASEPIIDLELDIVKLVILQV